MLTNTKSIWTHFMQSPVRKLGLMALVVAIALGLFGYRSVEDFLANASTELASIAFTVLIIDYLNERRAERQLKAQLIREMGGSDNGLALRAVKELKAYKWLEGGSLNGADLTGANLETADLTMADLQRAHLDSANLRKTNLTLAKLQGAFLRKADLQDAILIGANLHGAYGEILKTLQDEQLAQARWLHGATMPDGSRYNGHLNLLGDIKMAKLEGMNTDDPTAMARWYETTPDPKRMADLLIKKWQELHPNEEWSMEKASELVEVAKLLDKDEDNPLCQDRIGHSTPII